MRDRVKVSNLTILFICPSNDFGTIERRALKDCIYLRDIGGNPSLFCLRNSQLAEEAQAQDIPVIYYSGKSVKRGADLAYWKDIRALLTEKRFDMFHCYGLDYVWMPCLSLITNSSMPLIVSENCNHKKNYRNMVYRWLSRRIDLLLVFSKSSKDEMSQILPISQRKMQFIGGGIEVGKKQKQEHKSKKIIGAMISRGPDLLKKIEMVLYAIPFLMSKTTDLGLELEFVFYSDRPWVTVKDFPQIQQLIENLGVAEVVKFEHYKESAEQIIQTFNIYIGTEFDEPFNDFEVMALLYFVPTILPRTASRQELLSDRRMVGETYHAYDSRELKDKLLKILLDESLYISQILRHHEGLSDQHGMEGYFQRLTFFYENNYEKRIRIAERMKRPNPS